MRIGLWSNSFNFGCRDQREKPHEQKETGKEQAERAEVSADVHPRGPVITPTAGDKVLVERAHDDHEPLKPHADVHEDGYNEHENQVLPRAFEPEDLRRQHVEQEHSPTAIPISAEEPMPECPAFVRVATVPGNEVLHRVGIADDGTR